MRTTATLVAALLIAMTMHAATPKPSDTPRVNVNAATTAQLMLLPGIGTVIAQRVVDYRTQHGQFRQVSDLRQVKGIGEKKLATLAPFVALSGPTTAGAKIKAPR